MNGRSPGTKVWELRYLPYGGVHTVTGAPIDLRFPGQWFQSESGLYQNWMRDYDPTTGHYIQADPLGLVDGPSVYQYAKASPGRYVDPRGTEAVTVPGGVGFGDLPKAGVSIGGRFMGGLVTGLLYPTTPALQQGYPHRGVGLGGEHLGESENNPVAVPTPAKPSKGRGGYNAVCKAYCYKGNREICASPLGFHFALGDGWGAKPSDARAVAETSARTKLQGCESFHHIQCKCTSAKSGLTRQCTGRGW